MNQLKSWKVHSWQIAPSYCWLLTKIHLHQLGVSFQLMYTYMITTAFSCQPFCCWCWLPDFCSSSAYQEQSDIEEVWNPSILRRPDVSTVCSNKSEGVGFPQETHDHKICLEMFLLQSKQSKLLKPNSSLLLCFSISIVFGRSIISYTLKEKKLTFPFICWSKSHQGFGFITCPSLQSDVPWSPLDV